jgi:hypothetical protein
MRMDLCAENRRTAARWQTDSNRLFRSWCWQEQSGDGKSAQRRTHTAGRLENCRSASQHDRSWPIRLDTKACPRHADFRPRRLSPSRRFKRVAGMRLPWMRHSAPSDKRASLEERRPRFGGSSRNPNSASSGRQEIAGPDSPLIGGCRSSICSLIFFAYCASFLGVLCG